MAETIFYCYFVAGLVVGTGMFLVALDRGPNARGGVKFGAWLMLVLSWPIWLVYRLLV